MSLDSARSKSRQDTLSDVQPTSELWSKYEQYRQVADKEWTNEWKASMDGVIIFAGLFSAVITAFINQSMTNMKPDPAVQAVDALQTISLQLKVLSDAVVNASNAGPVRALVNASVPNAYVAGNSLDDTYLTVNILWIFALVISLICALCALLVQSWTRGYLAKMAKVLDPLLRSKTRLFLRKALRRYHVDGFVSAITASLHVSVFLFLGGLMRACWQAEPVLGKVVKYVMIPFGVAYFLSSTAFLIACDWPFDTAVSAVLKAILNQLSGVNPKDVIPNYTLFALLEGGKPTNNHIDKFIAHDDYVEITDSIMQKGSVEHAEFYQRLIMEQNLGEEFLTLTLGQIHDSLTIISSDGQLGEHQLKSSKIYLEMLVSLLDSFTLKQAHDMPDFEPKDGWPKVASACSPYINAGGDVRRLAIKASLLIAFIHRSLDTEKSTFPIEDAFHKINSPIEADWYKTQISLLGRNIGYASNTTLPCQCHLPIPPGAGEDEPSPAQTMTAVSSPPSGGPSKIQLSTDIGTPARSREAAHQIQPYKLLFSSCNLEGALPVLCILEQAVRTIDILMPPETPCDETVASIISMILELPVTSDNEAPQGALTRMINAISKILPFSNKGKDPTEAEESTKDPVEVEERVRVFGTISKLFPFLANCKESTKVDITQALTKRCERSSISEKRLALEGQWNSMVGLAQVVATDYPQSPPVVDEYAKPPSVLFNGSSGSLTVPEEYELPVLGLTQEPRTTLNAAEEAV